MHKKVQKQAKQAKEEKQNSREKTQTKLTIKDDGSGRPIWRLGGSQLHNGFGQVIPEGGSVWVKRCLWKRQTAKRGGGVNSTGFRWRRLGPGWGLNGLRDEHKPWKILNKWQRVATSWRLARVGRSEILEKLIMRKIPLLQDNTASKPLRGLNLISQLYVEGIPGGRGIFKDRTDQGKV